METKANYVLIGTFTILVTVFLLGFALWAAKFSSDASWQRYQVIFNEPVTGLTEGSSVQYNGISVGTVEQLKLDARDPRRVQALLKLEADAPIKIDTRAKMSQAGLTGSPFIQLTGGSPGAQLLRPRERSEIPVIQTEPSALQNIADTANKLVARLDEALSEENIQRISDTLENLRATTDAFSSQREDIQQMLINARLASEDLRKTLDTTNGAISKVDREVIAKLPATMEKLDRAIASFESAGTNANALVAENRAPLRSFTRDGLQQVAPTLTELRSLMRDIKQITDRLDGNPAGYLLGREQPKEFTPE
ncbi:MlaD family protein [Solilutibacter tolerans]|uniref:Phospholipid/cholesterol/gamma-HCH transport system substrate-binding protein n=1 Tax=Solilutibacter tolerans TaxID=1604334 RepID=A0A1N6N900_9GAMM|nr:MlaD family protein [Lysobacter tolerans]SIP88553.1 phospholipid/cholesterol/gamma-HCH transport system substrate-binding protein [Lysobacter tolerans]